MTAEEYVAKYETDLMNDKDPMIFVTAVSSLIDELSKELLDGPEIDVFEKFGERLDRLCGTYDGIVDILQKKHGKSPLKRDMFYNYIMKKVQRAMSEPTPEEKKSE